MSTASPRTAARPTITLRPPLPDDRERLRTLVETTGVFRPDETAIALEVFDDAVDAPGTDYWSVGAYLDGRLVGWAAFGPTPCTLGTWDLYWIVVDPAHQGAGIGRRLMAHCETAVRRQGGRLVVVETSSRDAYDPTRRFYRRLGYEAQAIVPAYYAPDDDLVVFVKSLGSSRNEKVPHG